MLYLLKMTKHPSQYKKTHIEYKLYTKNSTKKKEHFKIDTKVLFFFIDLKSRLYIKYLEGEIKKKRQQGTANTISRSVVHTDIRYTVSRRGTFKKSWPGLKTNQARGRNERSAGLTAVRGGQGQCGNVLYVNTEVSQTRRPMALPKCFHPLESGASATNKQTNKHGSEVTNWLTGRFWSKEARRQIADGGGGGGVEISSPSPPSADPRIRICGWWGTGGEGRVFLPGLAGGQACVR